MANIGALAHTHEPLEHWAHSPQLPATIPTRLTYEKTLWHRASDLALIQSEAKFSALQIPAIPLLSCGLARGTITEIIGPRSSGRTASFLHILAQATRGGEICAVIDVQNSFHPASAISAGVLLNHIVWVRCGGRLEHAIRSVDLILHAGGFGMVVLDFCETSPRLLNRIPLSYWFRFRRAIENTPTILLSVGETNQAKSCSVNILFLKMNAPHWHGQHGFRLLCGTEIAMNLRKPVGRTGQTHSLTLFDPGLRVG
jgi:RecA DNA recombination protein